MYKELQRRLSLILLALLVFWAVIEVIENAYEFGMKVATHYHTEIEYQKFLEYFKNNVQP